MLFVTFLAAALLAAILTRAFIGWVETKNIAAEENHRSMHKGRVPVGGGLPLLVVAILIGCLLWPLPAAGQVLLAALAALAVVSWADDVMTVPAVVRFAAHIAAAAAALSVIPPDRLVLQGLVPFALDRALSGLALVWFVNLFNFMDGVDGIAGIETVAISAGYAVVVALAPHADAGLVPLAVATAGAALGFLLWNWHPARIFMGDVGAVPLGFLTGWLMLDLASRGYWAPALVLPLYFVADATITLLRRILRGDRPWEPHREHFYQRAAKAWGNHAVVVRQVLVLNAALVGYAAVAVSHPWIGLGLAAAAVAMLLNNLGNAAPAASEAVAPGKPVAARAGTPGAA